MTRRPAKPSSRPASPKTGLTPALRQWFAAKESCPDAVLFFQMGDFYELFFDDATTCAPLLDLTLTSRQKLSDEPVPLCGVPLSSAEGYVTRLVSLGFKVAVCDQISSPGPGAGLADRAVRRLVTPGTVVEAQASDLPRWLAAAVADGGEWALCALDLSAGDFLAGRWEEAEGFRAALNNLEPAELLLPRPPADDSFGDPVGDPLTEPGGEPFDKPSGELFGERAEEPGALGAPGGKPAGALAGELDANLSDKSGKKFAQRRAAASGDFRQTLSALAAQCGAFVSLRPPEDFDPEKGAALLAEVYADRLPAVPLTGWPLLQGAAGALLAYCRALRPAAAPLPGRPEPENLAPALPGLLPGPSPSGGAHGGPGAAAGSVGPAFSLGHLAEPRLLSQREFLGLDEAAVRNLELFKSLRDGGPHGTLLSLLDLTVSPMGARLLRQWLARPLMDRARIEERHQAVEELLAAPQTRQELQDLLGRSGDLERSSGRLALGRGTVRDLAALRGALRLAPQIQTLLAASPSTLLARLGQTLDPLPGLLERLERSLADPLPLGDREAALIRPGLSPRLDELRGLESGGRRRLAELETKERRRTGIGSLKISYNKVFGYFFEVTRANLSAVPSDWRRKQTISGGERFVTDELKLWEEKILTAGEKRAVLEERLVERLKFHAAAQAPGVKTLAALLAEADVLAALAACAEKRRWTKPVISADDLIDVKGGRHPVVEAFLPSGEPFVENDVFLSHRERLLIITGPNMAGKSTVLRQTALMVVLCQMGSYVPATSAKLSIRDQVFTRVGASDDLARGQSTFMVEMTETARILQKATCRSLIVLDEVGRGTSTYDGLAIAWAVAEHLHDLGGRGAATLFATHYHELIELAKIKPLTRNYNVSVKRWGQGIVFLRKLAPGGVSRSYGLDVASLAGLPPGVIKRAREVLADLGRQAPQIRNTHQRDSLFAQAGLGQDAPAALVREILTLKTEELTPMAALNLLCELKTRAAEVLS
ncbi:MAG: DNA mismatch repair protein MutS [Deltaproteobacteria bacterium]|nr:DNA mismatch repair protein MutS [Deltaproteobacteria bacterium]